MMNHLAIRILLKSDRTGLQINILIINGTAFNSRSNAMTVLKNGDVGIGTVSPDAPLHIAGGNWDINATEGDLKIGSSSVRMKMSISLTGAGSGLARINAMGGNNPQVLIGAEGTDMAAIGESMVGIGTLIPDQTFSVNGNASKTGGGSWAVFSDRRIKKDVTDYEEGLSLVMKLHPVNFRYSDDYLRIFGDNEDVANGKLYQGVIAQELQNIAPDMVTETHILLNPDDPESKLLSVDPSKLTWTLINAVQEQQEIIQRQKVNEEKMLERIGNLETLLNTQNNRIGQILLMVEMLANRSALDFEVSCLE